MDIILTFIIFMTALVCLMLLSNVYMRFWLKVLVEKKHEWLDFIIATQCVPPQWSKRYNKLLTQESGHSADLSRIESIKKRARRDYLRRLKKLQKYLEHATLVPSEAERMQLQKALQVVADQWRDSDEMVFMVLSEDI